MDWTKLFAALAAAGIAFFLYRYIRAQPEMLSRANLGKSFYTMGLLGLGLIGLIAFCIWFLNA